MGVGDGDATARDGSFFGLHPCFRPGRPLGVLGQQLGHVVVQSPPDIRFIEVSGNARQPPEEPTIGIFKDAVAIPMNQQPSSIDGMPVKVGVFSPVHGDRVPVRVVSAHCGTDAQHIAVSHPVDRRFGKLVSAQRPDKLDKSAIVIIRLAGAHQPFGLVAYRIVTIFVGPVGVAAVTPVIAGIIGKIPLIINAEQGAFAAIIPHAVAEIRGDRFMEFPQGKGVGIDRVVGVFHFTGGEAQQIHKIPCHAVIVIARGDAGP